MQKPATIETLAPKGISVFKMLNSTALLTGSRFFGNHYFGSDYDFYINTKPNGGFEKISSDHYKHDINIVAFWEASFRGVKIQVQQVSDMALKTEAQNILATLPEPMFALFLSATKTEKAIFWHWAYEIAFAIRARVK